MVEIAAKRLDEFRLLLRREGGMVVEATIFASDAILMEDSAVRQLRDAASLEPVVAVCATPDIHQGYGVPIGCVMGMDGAIMPAAVGYDINCGMRMITTPLSRGEVDVKSLVGSIARDIPLGEGKHNVRLTHEALERVLRRGVPAVAELLEELPQRIREAFDAEEFQRDLQAHEDGGSLAGDPAAISQRAYERGAGQLATLGGGNHFIELQYVEQIYDADAAEKLGVRRDQVVVMIHSGSRGFGHQVADEYMKAAAGQPDQRHVKRDLAYIRLDRRLGQRYIGAMNAAANFAYTNRHLMMLLVRRNLRAVYGRDIPLELVYDVAHNIAKLETHNGRRLWVHRKGATRAFGPRRMAGTSFSMLGQPVIIPGSMGTASYLLLGVDGNEHSLCSVNHGAGRTMSRAAARGKVRRRDGKVMRAGLISDEEFREAMKGVELIAEDRRAVKEEAPQAYKDIDEVIRVVVGAGLARPVARMRPMGVLKG